MTNDGGMHRRQWLAAAGGCLASGAVWAQAADTAEKPVLWVSGAGAEGTAVQRTFSAAALAALPQAHIVTQTPWYDKARRFSGPSLSELLKATGVKGRVVRATALNDYSVEIPFSDAADHGVVVARLLDGQPMSVRDRGPLFVIYPFDDKPALRTPVFFGRCIWQLRRLEVLA
jgi:hypothetical protein